MKNLLLGKGMVVVFTDIEPTIEDGFNLWYDKEHCFERVKIHGFLRSRRYVAELGSPKYLSLSETKDFNDLNSEQYLEALAN